jgi:opacity protein-like surface antigen
MKRIALLVVIALAALSLSAQVVKLDVGTTFSSMQDDTPTHNFTKTLVGNSLTLGVDWLENNWYYLSSEVGYMSTGGVDRIDIIEGTGLPIEEIDWRMQRHNIHVNTTFRAKLGSKKFHAYLGIGPKLDIPVKTTMNQGLDDVDNVSFIKNEVMFGLKAEAGVAYNFNDVRVGLNFAYLPDLTRQASFLNQTTRNNIFKLGISVGYIFK